MGRWVRKSDSWVRKLDLVTVTMMDDDAVEIRCRRYLFDTKLMCLKKEEVPVLSVCRPSILPKNKKTKINKKS